MKILGIESSCDESAAALAEMNGQKVRILSNVVSSQVEIHKKYGGVVPEVAAREHVVNILPVINEALGIADFQHNHLRPSIDAIAITVGPGLITSLMAGVETAKVLSYAWKVPLVAINHIEGHVYANFIEVEQDDDCKTKSNDNNELYRIIQKREDLRFPAIVLTVSGGHTMLVLMEGHGKYQTIGETRDDAAGEAFDKAAKLLGVGYPGGPVIASEAEKYSSIDGKMPSIILPRPMLDSKDFDFSFSGLKTAIRYQIEKDQEYRLRIPEYCHEFQQSVIDVLIAKTIKAAIRYNVKTIMLSGGVSANKELRRQMASKVELKFPDIIFRVPELRYTTDNAAMIAVAGCYKALRGEFTEWRDLRVNCNLKL